MLENDLTLIKEAALEAGKIAAYYFGKDPQIWEKDHGAGPVTQADLEIDQLLNSTLLQARPHYGWLSEETADDCARCEKETIFIVDPIDGTRAFIEGSKHFAVAVAVVTDGKPIASVVHMPLLHQTYWAEAGKGAHCNETPLNVAPTSEGPFSLLAKKATLASQHWAAPPQVTRHFRSSLAYRMALVAEGAFDAMMTRTAAWEWDIVAGDLLVREAGGLVTDCQNAPLTFNSEQGKLPSVLAGGDAVHRHILSHLTPML